MVATNRVMSGGLVLAVLISVGPICGCPSEVADPTQTQNSELAPGELTLYSHPDDPRILGGLTEDGEGLTLYAQKDGRGLPTNLTAVRYQTPGEVGTEIASWVFFDDTGRLQKMLGADGSTFVFDWIGDARVAVSAVSYDGSEQVHTTMSTPGSSSAKRAARTTNPHPSSADAKDLTWSSNNSVIIYVERCGRPVDDAQVFVTFGSPGAAADPSVFPLQLPARRTRAAGEYRARLPAHEPIIDATDGEICAAIAAKLGDGCNLAQVPGGKDLLCTELGTVLAAYHPVAGGGAFGSCEVVFSALSVYCDTLGKGVAGSPTLADAICSKIKQNENSPLSQQPFSGIALSRAEIQAVAHLPGGASGFSAPVNVPSAGPFPELLVNLEDTPAVSELFTTPADPQAGEDYVATARLTCIPTDSVVRLSVTRGIAGISYYSDSTSLTIRGNDPDPVIELPVPDARAEAVDLVLVEIVGGDLQRSLYVSFDAQSGDGDGNGDGDCGLSDDPSQTMVFRGEATMTGTSQANFGLHGSATLSQTVQAEVRLYPSGTARATISGDQVMATTCPMGSDPGGDTHVSSQNFTTSWSGTHADGNFELRFGELGAQYTISGTYERCTMSGSGQRSGSFEIPCPSGTQTGQQTLSWTFTNLPRVE
jgi:hypothetical protein